MAQEILNVSQLKVGVEDKEILHGVDLSLNKGETHVLMGPNGAGKSTLGYALMGNPRYEILGGKVTFNGEDLLSKNVAERSQAGLFLSFQNPIEVPGITLGNFIRRWNSFRWIHHIWTETLMLVFQVVRRRKLRYYSFLC